MGKQKKTSASSEFTGFTAYASHSSTAATAVKISSGTCDSIVPEARGKQALKPIPVYVGSNSNLIQIFKRIGQKKDYVTKSRALAELCSYLYPIEEEDDGSINVVKTNLKKSEQIVALSHFFFLFSNKLIHENNVSVQSAAIKVLGDSLLHAPKAFRTLLLYQDPVNNTSDNTQVGSIGNVIGWVYTFQLSQMSDVAKASKETWTRIFDLLKGNQANDYEQTITLVQESVVRHVESLLKSSSRAQNLADALSVIGGKSMQKQDSFAKESRKKGKPQAKKIGNNHISESEKEEMRERYERVVILTLRGTDLLLRSFPEKRIETEKQHERKDTFVNYINLFTSSSVLWKHLSSNQASFRLSSYNVITCLCKNASSIIHPKEDENKSHNLSNLMLNALSSEREPSNFPSLFEMILMFISSFKNCHPPELSWDSSTISGEKYGMDSKGFMKALSKILRRACYGSPSSKWAPSMLPLLASMPRGDGQIQLQVLTSLWSGRSAAVVAADAVAIVTAVAECSSYILLRKSKENETISDQFAHDCGQFFLDSLSFCLTVSDGGSAFTAALSELVGTLSKELYQLDTVIGKRNNCAFQKIEKWLWEDGMRSAIVMNDELNVSTLDKILLGFISFVSHNGLNEVRNSHFCPILRSYFYNLFSEKCSPEYYEASIILTILEFCGVQYVFDGDREKSFSFDSFCMRNLLPWIILHTTAAPYTVTKKATLQILFKILLAILKTYGTEERRHLWSTMIQEIIQDQCDLGKLTEGLIVIGTENPEFVRCRALDNFAIKIGETIVTSYLHQAEKIKINNDHEAGLTFFFQGILGLLPSLHSMLVGHRVVQSWCTCVVSADFMTPQIYNRRNTLLEALLSFTFKTSTLSDTDTLDLVLMAWRQGGPTWNCKELKNIVRNDDSLLVRLISAASSELQKNLRTEVFLSGKNMDINSYIWSQRAWRLLQITEYLRSFDSSQAISMVGLDNINLWKSDIEKGHSRCDARYLHLMYLLNNIEDQYEREKLLLGGHSSNYRLLVFILMTFLNYRIESSRWDENVFSRCQYFMTFLGEISPAIIEGCCFEAIELLTHSMENHTTESLPIIERGIIVLCGLFSLYCKRTSILGLNSDDVSQSDLKEGDTVWYITDGDAKDSPRVKATVKEIHTDDYPNLYFTVQLDKNEFETKLRQTVAGRLKTQQRGGTSDSLNHSDIFMRRVEDAMVSRLVTPYLGNCTVLGEAAAEILNIVISRCQLRGQSGIGTVRFDVFQLLCTLEKTFLKLVKSETVGQCSSSLVRMSLALGYGRLSEPSNENCAIVRFSCGRVMNSIMQLFEKEDLIREQNSRFHEALLIWLSVSVDSTINKNNVSQILSVLGSITSKVRGDEFCGCLSKWLLLSLTAFHSMQIKMTAIPDSYATNIASEQDVISNLLEMLIKLDPPDSSDINTGTYFSTRSDDMLVRRREQAWTAPFKMLLIRNIQEQKSTFATATKIHVEDLCRNLLVPEKQWCAFQLLTFLAQRGQELYSGEDVVLLDGTCSRLDKTWKCGLDQQEASELEQDILTTAKWLPRHLMSVIESWKETKIVRDNKNEERSASLITFFLEWLLCLEFLDAAAASDMRNRSHISSYIEKTGATKEVLELALDCAKMDKEKKGDWFSCTSINCSYSILLVEVSTLAIFRTVESIPTICKAWWSDYCPRSLQPVVNRFVENSVAPETLRRELIRINKADNLGELVVNGSCVSREITATYIQDECKLSVLIRIPPSFPFRNVEVDCQKTLGISEKRWRHWSLIIMRMLNSQDGCILDALLLWKQNVDKEFEGVEPCPVCYSVLCVKTHAMPNLECKVCSNRFHSSCLYKWFNSSGKNQCVICQQPWNGTKVA